MNINPISSYDNGSRGNKKYNNPVNEINNKQTPMPSVLNNTNFKGGATFLDWARNFDFASSIGNFKQWIETMGFVALFLIQDGLGMTLPRTVTGFNRDREVTGKFHIQEGLEVLGREGLTGPIMMAIPAGIFWLTKRGMGQSTYVNSRLIKSFGKAVAGMAENRSLKNTQLRPAVIAEGFRKMFKETTGLEASDNIISKSMNSLAKFEEVKKFKAPDKMTVDEIQRMFGSDYDLETIKAITKNADLKQESSIEGRNLNKLIKAIKKDLENPMRRIINETLLNTRGADLSRLNRFALDGSAYDTKTATDGLRAYAHDVANKFEAPENLTSAGLDEFMYSMIGKRWTANIAAGATVLGVMNYLPKLYAFGDKPPGETSKCETEHKQNVQKDDKQNIQNSSVSFKGGFSAMGRKIAKWKDFVLAEGEFNKFNFSPTLMSGISVVGLTIPRASRAYERAPIKTEEQRQNDGWFSRLFKKDISEIKEIAIRDPLSALFVVFAVPLATRGIIKSYEKASGFVLIDHEKDEGKGLKKLGKYLNPYSNISVINNAELDALYGGIDSHKKLVNVCEYLDRKGGDLARIFTYAVKEDQESIFNEKSFTLKSLKKMKKEEKNKKILDYIRNANPDLQKKMVDSLLPAVKKLKNNRALGIAKTFNSIPFLLNLLIISPFLLGVTIPKYTYKLTRSASDKAKGIPEPKGPAQPPDREKYLKQQETEKTKAQTV